MATYPTAKMVKTTVAKIYPAGAPVPLPNPTATGTLPVIAVIGAAVATAMKMTSKRPTALGLSLPYSWVSAPVLLPTPDLVASLPSNAPPRVTPRQVRYPLPSYDRPLGFPGSAVPLTLLQEVPGRNRVHGLPVPCPVPAPDATFLTPG